MPFETNCNTIRRESPSKAKAKRWSSLKHYMYSVGFKKKALRSQRLFEGKGSSKTKALRWQRQRPFEGKGESSSKPKAKDFGMQRPLGGKGPWEAKPLREQGTFKAKGPSKAKPISLRRQRRKLYEGKDRSKSKPKAFRRQGQRPFEGKVWIIYNCTPFTILLTHNHSSLAWYVWVRGCCISRESMSEDVAMVEDVAME